jgi:hypothetical protein
MKIGSGGLTKSQWRLLEKLFCSNRSLKRHALSSTSHTSEETPLLYGYRRMGCTQKAIRRQTAGLIKLNNVSHVVQTVEYRAVLFMTPLEDLYAVSEK